MASESVGILIEADDQASAKLQQVADNADRQVKRIREVGGKAKASTEFIGTLANSLGGTQLGGFAGELGQLTERISAFSEVSKAGGAGALAFKAGLLAATAVVSVRVGETIAGWVYDTQQWTKELEAAGKEAQRLDEIFAKRVAKEFSQGREDLSLIRDPGDREAATNARAAELEKQARMMDGQLAEKRKEVAKREADARGLWASISNDPAENLKMSQQELADTLKRKQGLLEEAQALRELVDERAKSIESKKAENAAADRSDAFLSGLREQLALTKATKEEQFALEAQKNAVGPEAQAEAQRILKEIDALKEKAKAEDELAKQQEQARQKQIAEADRIADIEKREVQRLEERRIAMEQGKEAARAYALQQQGLDDEAAKRLAAKETQLDLMQAQRSEAGPLQATQGRLLTRGPGGNNPIDKLNKTAERQAKAAEDANIKLQQLYEAQKNNKPLTVAVVG